MKSQDISSKKTNAGGRDVKKLDDCNSLKRCFFCNGTCQLMVAWWFGARWFGILK